jgi:hypothetical protein
VCADNVAAAKRALLQRFTEQQSNGYEIEYVVAATGQEAAQFNLPDDGYMLANEGHERAIQAYLGHRNIQNTMRYTAVAPQRFKGNSSGIDPGRQKDRRSRLTIVLGRPRFSRS